jgi:hypothetical protein
MIGLSYNPRPGSDAILYQDQIMMIGLLDQDFASAYLDDHFSFG